MSTRRARIKAVAVLPPRRKNVNNSEVNKKPATPKETVEKLIKSPQTPKSQPDVNEDDAKSPSFRSPLPTINPGSVVSFSPVSVPKSPIPAPGTPIPYGEPSSPYNGPKSNTPSDVVISSTEKILTENVFTSSRSISPIQQQTRDIITSPITQGTIDESHAGNSKQKPSEQLTNNVTCDMKLVDDVLKLPANSVRKSTPADEYSIPSIPESIPGDGIMDGIAPLSSNKAPPPIELFKNEIISENAEVFFDPIVPLPSPSKVRPKLRPIPRLGLHRRNSMQGSASESEDESRRALLGTGPPTPAPPPPPRQRHDSQTSHMTLPSVPATPARETNRTRNDSVCSSVSAIGLSQPPPATSPVKDKHLLKARRHEMGKRMWRRRRETVARDALTMYDLIFYNPTTNPIVPDQDEIKAKEEDARDKAEREAREQEQKEEPDDPPETAPVPRIKLGANGEIVLDEQSLVIKPTAPRKVTSVVREGAWGGGGGRYTRATRTADWSAAETVRFYRALAAVGTDFSLMAQLFPSRARRDLKLKFKKEERLNGAQVDMALRSATSWELSQLEKDFEEERAEALRQEEAAKQQLAEDKLKEKERLKRNKKLRFRQSRGAKALESTPDIEMRFEANVTANEFIQRAIMTRANKKKPQNDMPPPDAPAPTPNPQTSKNKTPEFATLTLMGQTQPINQQNLSNNELATLSRVDKASASSNAKIINSSINPPPVPSNIETGSLVVLRVNDPNAPTKTMLQTYISHGAGKLTPVALPSTFLNSVVGYMKIDSPKAGNNASTTASPLISPLATTQEAKAATPSVIQVTPSPNKRQRHSSFTITTL